MQDVLASVCKRLDLQKPQHYAIYTTDDQDGALKEKGRGDGRNKFFWFVL